MLSSPYVLTSSGDKRYFRRYPEVHPHYPYGYEPPAAAREPLAKQRTARIGSEWPSMPTPIPPEPHENDVLMGRGGRNNQHSGNDVLRQFARLQGENYRVATKKGKSAISRLLVRQMRDLHPPARFLKRVQQTAAWEEASEETAREKASQVLRDAVAGLLEGKDDDIGDSHNDDDEEVEEEMRSVQQPQPPPTVSAPVSLDDHDHERQPRRAAAAVARQRPLDDFEPPYHPRRLVESTESKRQRRYASADEGPVFLPFYDERYSSRQPPQQSQPQPPLIPQQQQQQQQGVGYSPIRRHSQHSYATIGSHSDPTTSRRVPPSSHLTAPPPPRSAPGLQHQRHHHPQQQPHNAAGGNLDEFDLFNGELLESDTEDDGPPAPDVHRSAF